jgi:DegV family protein with EDD domain
MIRIVSDSSCYLSPEVIAEREIEVVPLKVHFGDDEIYDEITGISNKEFYRRLTTGNVFPTTSQPPIGEFQAAYQKVLQDPSDQILAITLSSKLSGTFSSAQTAVKFFPEISITPFDSLSLAIGMGLMVMTASDMALSGQPMPAILARLEHMRQNMHIVFTLDTLEYLRRGGRIGATSAFIGGLLKFKPILAIVDGVIKPVGKVRTRRKAINSLLDELKALVPDSNTPVQIGAMHVDEETEMHLLLEQVNAMYRNVRRTITGEIGPALGAHGGPGILGVGICPEPQD